MRLCIVTVNEMCIVTVNQTHICDFKVFFTSAESHNACIQCKSSDVLVINLFGLFYLLLTVLYLYT